MAQYTQKAIISTFEQMLVEMPFDKITVSALVRRCEISSNTFYYHYKDIYDLLNVWLRGKFGNYTQETMTYAAWKKNAKDFFRSCVDNSAMVYHIFNSLSRDRMERFVFTLSEDIFFRLVGMYAAEYDVPQEKLSELADVCRFTFAGLFLRFIWGRMKEDIDTMVDSYSDLLSSMVLSVVEKYPKKQ